MADILSGLCSGLVPGGKQLVQSYEMVKIPRTKIVMMIGYKECGVYEEYEVLKKYTIDRTDYSEEQLKVLFAHFIAKYVDSTFIAEGLQDHHRKSFDDSIDYVDLLCKPENKQYLCTLIYGAITGNIQDGYVLFDNHTALMRMERYDDFALKPVPVAS